MGISDVISLLGGIALFLFGMSLMGEGLKKNWCSTVSAARR